MNSFYFLLIAFFVSTSALSQMTADMTPLGGERAGNGEGTIPEWTGGITAPPAGYLRGEHHRDPFPQDRILLTIDASNRDEYRDRLSEGHWRMLGQYSTFKLNIYPTRRSASVPSDVELATLYNSTRAKLIDNGNGVEGALKGIPFPVPKNGAEAIWNHLLRYRGERLQFETGRALVLDNGNYSIHKYEVSVISRYAIDGMREEDMKDKSIFFKLKVKAPASSAGDILLVHESINRSVEGRNVWEYLPDTRRVRRNPSIAYDYPIESTNGLVTADQFDLYNGAIDQYDWKLVGKREMYVPYNSYKVHSDRLKHSDILHRHHVNPEHLRYELHRVHMVEATLKAGKSHRYGRRTFYLDEDSWQILLVDIYDGDGNLWRVSEGHVINYYEKPLLMTTLETSYDLKAKSYVAYGLDNEYSMIDFEPNLRERDFTPSAIRREGR